MSQAMCPTTDKVRFGSGEGQECQVIEDDAQAGLATGPPHSSMILEA